MSSITLTGPAADRDAWTADACSIDAALQVIGRRATLLLMREALYGAHRFEEFVRRAGFSEAVTAARLHELVDAGLLERRPYQDPGQRRRDGYHLTEKGRDLYPALIALMQWGDRWAQADGAPLRVTHAGCGAPVHAEVRCSHGHSVPPDDAEAAFTGPSAPAERAGAAPLTATGQSAPNPGSESRRRADSSVPLTHAFPCSHGRR